jgi:hypothetical protein
MAYRKILPLALGWDLGGGSPLGCTFRPQRAGPSWIGSAREVGETLTAVVVVARFVIFIAGILGQHGLRSLWRSAVRRDTQGLRYRPDRGGAAAIRGDVPSHDHAGLEG